MACSYAGSWHPQGGRCHAVHGAVAQPIGQPTRQPIGHVALVRRWWRIVIEDSEFVLLGVEVFVAVAADFTIGTGIMCTAVPKGKD